MKRKEERISELKIKQKRLPNLQHEEKYTLKKKKKKQKEKEIEQRPRDMWNNNKRSKFYVIKIPERDQKRDGDGKIFKEIMTKNLLNLAKV